MSGKCRSFLLGPDVFMFDRDQWEGLESPCSLISLLDMFLILEKLATFLSFQKHSYLAGVTTAKMRQHISNMSINNS